MESFNVLKYIWGKAKEITIDGNKQLLYHPLICHLIDAAAVAEMFWDNILSKILKDRLQVLFSLDEESTKSFIIFLAAIHDIGKATPIFQSKMKELALHLTSYGLDTFDINIFHSVLSGQLFFVAFSSILSELKINNRNLIQDLRFIIAGHHGRFPKKRNFDDLIPDYLGDSSWREVQELIIQIVRDFCKIKKPQREFNHISYNGINIEERNVLLTFLTGFITIVDWISSNEDFFNYFIDFENKLELKEKYFQISRERAKNALEKIGWLKWKDNKTSKECKTFKQLFPYITEIRPLQKLIIEWTEKISNPCLIIIEAPMGEGKTEAALYLEHYLEHINNLNGSYIALPTQATANQMFQRVLKFLSIAKNETRVNLHLLHGNAIINKDYSLLRTKSKNLERDEESNIVADEWFTYRKRGLIAPFGVGTIDQILLSVLPLKHFFVRLFGLAGKTVIIDEVHSYDIYMSTLLEHLLYWLRLLCTNVILLSATLPSFKREKLIKTYYTDDAEIPKTSYPRVILCNEKIILSSSFEVSLKKQGDESIDIDWIDKNSIKEKVRTLLRQGGQIAIICNTIQNAQDLYLELKALKNNNIEVILLHSRFPHMRRMDIEKRVLSVFGKNKDHKSTSRVLISTQIIEQSLDLDFDLMISELAPIDFLFQRIGRLHRHTHDNEGNKICRSELLKKPRFWVIQPEVNKCGIPQIRYSVYSKYILLKTYLYLKTTNFLSIPDDLEPYIENVYQDNSEIAEIFQNHKESWKIELEAAWEKQNSVERDHRIGAEYKVIPNPKDEDFFNDFSVYLEDNSPEAQQSLQALTRITSPSINLVCLYSHQDKFYLDKDFTIEVFLNKKVYNDYAKLILDYSIPISIYDIYQHFSNNINSIPKTWKKNALIRNIHYIILNKDDSRHYYFETEKNMVYLKNKLGLYKKNKRT